MAKVKKTINVGGFLKIGKKEHIKELHESGTIYCNTVKKFREIEKEDSNRLDEREGAYRTEVLDPDKLSLSIKGKKIPVVFTFARLNEFDNNINNHKLFCLFGFKEKHKTGKPFVDKKNINFGNKALIIFNADEFINRIRNQLEAMNLKYSLDFVTYYEEKKVNEQLSVFHKPKIFSYQNEFRFYIKHDSPDPLIFKIGSIEDISLIIDVEKLTKMRLEPFYE